MRDIILGGKSSPQGAVFALSKIDTQDDEPSPIHLHRNTQTYRSKKRGSSIGTPSLKLPPVEQSPCSRGGGLGIALGGGSIKHRF